MNYEEFVKEISDGIRSRFPGHDVHEEKVEKLQNRSYNGLVIRQENSNIGITINLDDLYKQLENGRSWTETLSMVTDVVRSAEFPAKDLNVQDLRDYRQMKEKLVLQMVPAEGNEKMLAKVPHQRMDDLAVVCRVVLRQDEQGEASFLVTNEALSAFGITQKQLMADAAEICEKNHPLSVHPMETVLFGIPEEEADRQGLWVIANETGRYGAAVISYPDALDRIAEKLGSGFYLIPSSIHEMLAVPDRSEIRAKDMDSMINGVNQTEVLPEERLGNHSYHYEKETHLFEKGTVYEERKDREQETGKMQEGIRKQEENSVREDEEGYRTEEKAAVLLVEPGRYPKAVETGTDLSSLQQAVGGYIEVIYPFEDEEACIICNEEGKISGMELNRALRDDSGKIEDIIAGPFLVAGLTEESFGSLSPEQLAKFDAQFHQPEVFARIGKEIIAIPVKDREEKAAEAAARVARKPEKAAEER